MTPLGPWNRLVVITYASQFVWANGQCSGSWGMPYVWLVNRLLMLSTGPCTTHKAHNMHCPSSLPWYLRNYTNNGLTKITDGDGTIDLPKSYSLDQKHLPSGPKVIFLNKACFSSWHSDHFQKNNVFRPVYCNTQTQRIHIVRQKCNAICIIFIYHTMLYTIITKHYRQQNYTTT